MAAWVTGTKLASSSPSGARHGCWYKEHLRVPSHSVLFRSALGHYLLAEAAHYSMSQKDVRWKELGMLQLWG